MALASTPRGLATVSPLPVRRRCTAGAFDEAWETRQDQERSSGVRFDGDKDRSCKPAACGRAAHRKRSEEHTSELQSRLHLVCRLLLEKKKTNHDIHLHK